MTFCKRVYIFEGVDGSGKTTAAKRLAKLLGARYVHFGPLPNVTKNLARLYVEAALPALLGYQDVVMDRSWLSEVPYGTVFRDSADRLGPETCRMLERIFMRCDAVVIMCDPGEEAVLRSFRSRKGDEYLDREEQLVAVRRIYQSVHTDLKRIHYSYELASIEELLSDMVDTYLTRLHHVDSETAGNADASMLLVGESYAERTDQDGWYQKPFCSFSGAGCSRWLTNQLIQAQVPEYELLWCNADHLGTSSGAFGNVDRVIALGAVAASRVREVFGRTSAKLIELEHPQSHKRFKSSQPYPLIEALK